MQPILETERLILRPFAPRDAARVSRLAGDERIADTTASIPHPYSVDMALRWISGHAEKWRHRETASFAIIERSADTLIGCISAMNITPEEAELGYWVGVEYWNKGYCSEACRRVVEFCFSVLEVKRVHAHHLSRNPASGRVLLKSGLVHIGSGESVCGYKGLKQPVEVYEILMPEAAGDNAEG